MGFPGVVGFAGGGAGMPGFCFFLIGLTFSSFAGTAGAGEVTGAGLLLTAAALAEPARRASEISCEEALKRIQSLHE